MTVYQLLGALGDTAERGDVGNYLRGIIRKELASETPAFCPQDGQGRVDATALRDFALAKAPATADQKDMAARAVIIGYLEREYPCR
ncbi:hypothetical protein A3731_05085 [Roseovarius sp. HI0049]|nr:hypothetical protein A3731_05085 [Roseovarius sp. HI0049]